MDKNLLLRLQQARQSGSELKTFLQKLGKKPPRDLDEVVREAHAEVFREVDCLQCANCCKTTSPIFRMVDIERLAKFLRVKPAELISNYLRVDEDNDYVLRSSPCVFLDEDNYCRVYEARPGACREYPHTDRKKFHQITALTWRNTQICPAAGEVVRKIMSRVKV